MTLQYRIRSKYEDDCWRQRVQLYEGVISAIFDRWCRSDADFPVTAFATGTLFLFSPRCDPENTTVSQLVEFILGKDVTVPELEYSATWPKRPLSDGQRLIDAITGITVGAIQAWENDCVDQEQLNSLPVQIVTEIVGQQYVVFHHKETTRRDFNHWGI